MSDVPAPAPPARPGPLARIHEGLHPSHGGDRASITIDDGRWMLAELERLASRPALGLQDEEQREIASLREAVNSLLTEEPMSNGRYPHLLHCNGPRTVPARTRGVACICKTGLARLKSVSALRGAAPETLDRKAQLAELIHACDIAYMLRGHDERYFALGRAIGFLKDLRNGFR